MILAEALTKELLPIAEKRRELLQKPQRIVEILEEGRKKASVIARQTIAEVKEAIFK